jgi:spore coat protein H
MSNDAGGLALPHGDAGVAPSASDASVTLPKADAAINLAIVAEPTDDATYLFDQTQLRTYNLIIAQADLDKIDQNPMAQTYVPAMLELEGKSYGPYGARYKGGFSSWGPPCVNRDNPGPKTGKCSIKIDFNQVDSKARFFGLKKINFHSMNADSSMLRERLAYSLFREMGLAAPRSTHARLLINGVLEGLFILTEQVDDRFTRSRFAEGGNGNLYKEAWPNSSDESVYLTALETNKNAQPPPSVQRMLDFKTAIDQGATAAEHFIDRDYMLRYTAVDRVIINDDGPFHWFCDPPPMPGRADHVINHNYYWYAAQNVDRLWLVPWDVDLSFNGYMPAHCEFAWTAVEPCACALNSQGSYERPASCDPLMSHLASWLKDYNAKVDQFIAGPFAQSPVEAKLSMWESQIQSAVAETAGLNGAPLYLEWLNASIQLRTTIDNARANRGYPY